MSRLKLVRERGMALLMMLMIAGLASALVFGMISRQSRIQRELASQLLQDQIAQYNNGAIFFAMGALRTDGEIGATVDHPGEFWAQAFPPYPVPGGLIQPILRDAQARFNLNSIANGNTINPAALACYRRLLAYLQLPPDLADSLADWIDVDNIPTSGAGAEDEFYLRLGTPYRTANRALSTLGELRLVKGYSKPIIQRLSAWVVVLPQGIQTMNVNFISPGLLEALVPGLPAATAATVIQNRPLEGWRSVPQFLDNAAFSGLSADVRQQVQSLLAVRSGFFELYTRIRLGSSDRREWALISRAGGQVRLVASERNPLWMPVIDTGTTAPALEGLR